jgi:hypothetical protein
MSSRISRYQESISRFIKTKSSYCEILKLNNSLENLISVNDHEASIILLTILNGQLKKKNLKSHGYHMAAGVDLMMSVVMINDNVAHFDSKFNKGVVKNFINQAPVYIYECSSQNIETLENMVDKEKTLKTQKKIHSFLHKKMLDITKHENIVGVEKPHRTDIIKYKFQDKTIINTKYRVLKIIDKQTLLNYVERTYGTVCQCAFVLGWLLGLGEEKAIPNLEKLGNNLGIIIKLSNDFKNLERDMATSNEVSYNMIVNCGIHECFSIFDDNKTSLIEGCLLMDVYSITIKEVIDNIEKKFDTHLKNTDLELNSRYSSFSTMPSK